MNAAAQRRAENRAQKKSAAHPANSANSANAMPSQKPNARPPA